jgi:hypothetical protein
MDVQNREQLKFLTNLPDVAPVVVPQLTLRRQQNAKCRVMASPKPPGHAKPKTGDVANAEGRAADTTHMFVCRFPDSGDGSSRGQSQQQTRQGPPSDVRLPVREKHMKMYAFVVDSSKAFTVADIPAVEPMERYSFVNMLLKANVLQVVPQ